jgi:hypothetical protein
VTVYQVTTAAIAPGGGVAAAAAPPNGWKGDTASKPKQINGHACTCEISVPCACTEEIVLLKAKFTGTGTEQWNILLVACPDQFGRHKFTDVAKEIIQKKCTNYEKRANDYLAKLKDEYPERYIDIVRRGLNT